MSPTGSAAQLEYRHQLGGKRLAQGNCPPMPVFGWPGSTLFGSRPWDTPQAAVLRQGVRWTACGLIPLIGEGCC